MEAQGILSDESDVKTQVELAHLNRSMREFLEGQVRTIAHLEEIRGEQRSMRAELHEVRAQSARAERKADEAKRATDENASESAHVHRSFAEHAEKTTAAIDALRSDTEQQTESLKRQDDVLRTLVTNGEKAELHRQWQRDQADAADKATQKRRATITYVLASIAAIVGILAAIYGVYRAGRAVSKVSFDRKDPPHVLAAH